MGRHGGGLRCLVRRHYLVGKHAEVVGVSDIVVEDTQVRDSGMSESLLRQLVRCGWCIAWHLLIGLVAWLKGRSHDI